MTDTLWADVSSWQAPVDDRYPHRVLAIRSNDGTYVDPRFAANYAWGLSALSSGRLDVLIVYYVWRQNYDETVNNHMRLLGAPHPGVASMIDVENWNGQVRGDQSDGINANVASLARFYGNQLRVIGYGNRSDLDSLWPRKPAGIRLVVAAYGSNPAYPGKLAHQYGDNVPCAPFGPCDGNSADGLDVAAVKDALGLTGQAPVPPTPPPGPPSGYPAVHEGDVSALIWDLQRFLNRTFPAYSHIDAGAGPFSRCGPATVAVVEEFQSRCGIPTTPPFEIGPKTWAKLVSFGFSG